MQREKVIDMPPSSDVREIATVPTAALARVEVDSQIATAKQYPRDYDRFASSAMKLVETVSIQKSTRDGGEELFYSMPRGGKLIEGPSVRLAEIIAHTYGNCRVGARTVSEEREFVVCQGVFHDLEQNVAITFEIKRRITRRDGTRYDDDMIGVTANAGCGIAYRNAVLKGVPKAFWLPLYEKARKLAGGAEKDAAKNRKAVLEYFSKLGAKENDVLRVAGVKTASDLGSEQIATLRGIATAIKDGDTTVAAAFSIPETSQKRESKIKEKPAAAQEAAASGPISGEQFDQIYGLLPDLKLTMVNCIAIMKKLGHTGTPKQFPAAKFQELIAALEKARRK
jgi:hypothetical protein